MGVIELNKGLCMVSVLINTYLLQAAKEKGGVDQLLPAIAVFRQGGVGVFFLEVDVERRNSDNTLIKKVFNREPNTKLRDAMEKTYKWIYDQMAPRYAQGATAQVAARV